MSAANDGESVPPVGTEMARFAQLEDGGRQVAGMPVMWDQDREPTE